MNLATILVVEDNRTSARIIQEPLTAEGYKVQVASDEVGFRRRREGPI